MRKAAVGLGMAVLLLLGLVGGARTLDGMVVPPITYAPRTRTAPPPWPEADPARGVEAALRRAGHLPPPGTRLIMPDGTLRWAALPATAAAITTVEACRVRLSGGASRWLSGPTGVRIMGD